MSRGKIVYDLPRTPFAELGTPNSMLTVVSHVVSEFFNYRDISIWSTFGVKFDFGFPLKTENASRLVASTFFRGGTIFRGGTFVSLAVIFLLAAAIAISSIHVNSKTLPGSRRAGDRPSAVDGMG